MTSPALVDVDPSRFFSPPEGDFVHPALKVLRGIVSPQDPYPRWEKRLEEGDPHLEWRDDGDGGRERVAMVYGWDAARDCFQHPDVGLSRVYREFLEPVTGRGMHCTDPPEHTRFRSAIEPLFQEEVERLNDGELRRIARELTDTFQGKRHFELLDDFAIPYPPRVIGRVLGLPDRHLEWYQYASYRFSAAYLFSRMGTVEADFLDEARRELREYLQAVVRAVRESKETPRGLLARLVHERRGGHRLSEEEILAFLMHLVPASGTSGMAIGPIVYGLLTHPRQYRRLRADLSRVSRAVEEGLRWEPPFAIVERQANDELVLNGTSLPAGTRILVHLASANHDPSRFEDPHAFDMTRDGSGHLSFAAGPHVCLGKRLAEREMEAAIRVLFDELGDFRIDPDRRDEVFRSGGFWRGVVNMPIEVGQPPADVPSA